MLESFRNHKRWLMFISMVLIIPSFVVTGIYSYNRYREGDHSLAEVGKVKIERQQYDQLKREELERLRMQLGEQFRPNMLETPEMRERLVTMLLDRASTQIMLNREHIDVSEAQAIEIIKAQSAFRGKDGRFDPELYARYLQSQGKSDAWFVHEIRQKLAEMTLVGGVTDTVTIPKTVVDTLYNLLTTEREVRTMIFNAGDYLSKVEVKPEELKAYYDSHQAEFVSNEHVNVQYVTLTPEDFVDSIKVDEDTLKTYYKNNQKRWTVGGERRASHILIPFGSDEAAAKAKADKIVAELREHPEKFAEVAKAESADPGSAKNGGDLNFFGPGMMVPEFDKAVFSAEKGKILDPVKTQFGYHIIEVTDVKPSTVRPYEEVRPEIVKLYQQEMAMREFAEKAEDFTNIVYEQPDSLEPVVEKFGLKLKTADDITRAGSSDPKLKKIFNAHVVDALYEAESLQEKRNTSAIEVGPNMLVSARVVKYFPKAVRPFDEVKAAIEQKIKFEKSLALAKADGEAKLKELREKPSDAGFSKEIWVSLSNARSIGFPDAVVSDAIAQDTAKLPVYIGTEAGGAYIITNVLKARDPEVKQENWNLVHNQIAQMLRDIELEGYLEQVRDKLGAKILDHGFIEGPKTEE